MNNQELLKFGIELVTKIADGITELAANRALGDEIGSIGASGDKTKYADDYSEHIVKSTIKEYIQQNPDTKVILISEETGLIEEGEGANGFFMVLDPLDGSNNLREWKTPAPNVGISLAMGNLTNLNDKNNFDCIDIAIVMDIFNKRICTAIRGEKASVQNFGEIRTSQETDPNKMIIGGDLDVQNEKYDTFYENIKGLMRLKKCFRRLGSSVLDMYKVGCGEYDAFVSIGGRLGFYDLAAVKLIIEEAGGIFTILNEQPDCIIKEIIKTKNNNLIQERKYKLVTSGNKEINDFILSNISI